MILLHCRHDFGPGVQVVALFGGLLSLAECFGLAQDGSSFTTKLAGQLVDMPWLVKGKYGLMGVALDRYGVK